MPRKVSSAPVDVPTQPSFQFPGKSAQTRPLWSQVDQDAVKALVSAWTDVEGAVLFGWTRDKTALSLTLYMDEEKASYTYGQVDAATAALEEYTRWALDWASRALKFNAATEKR